MEISCLCQLSALKAECIVAECETASHLCIICHITLRGVDTFLVSYGDGVVMRLNAEGVRTLRSRTVRIFQASDAI